MSQPNPAFHPRPIPRLHSPQAAQPRRGTAQLSAALRLVVLLVLVVLPALLVPTCGWTAAGPAAGASPTVVDLLPDIIVRDGDLYDHDIVTNIVPGHTHLRLSNGTPNIGAGKLYLYGVLPAYPDGTQDVRQRVDRSDGTYYDRPAGRFVYHPAHNHIHVEGWCIYRLRQMLPDGSVGPVVVEGAKTSFCILDLNIYDSSLPDFDSFGEFHGCNSTVQGLSVGWVDVYSKGLEGQNLDITGVPDGRYWLESQADPDNHILESDETNNVTRIALVLGRPGPINPDAYEPNGSRSAVDGRPAGGPNSPNLGPCGPLRVVSGLSVDQSGDDDYFKLFANDVGGAGDVVRIEFEHALGDLDMRLLNSSGTQVGVSTGVTNQEQISLQGRPKGWYYVRVYGYNNATNPFYTLTVDPPQNAAPSVVVLDPPAGNVDVIHGVENYTATWSASDPEGDLTWVTLYVNTTAALDGGEFLLPTTLYTSCSQGFAVINSAEVLPGTYWVYCAVTDGGTVAGSWSAGTVTFHEASTAVAERAGLRPSVTRLLAAAPNPFNPSTTLALDLAQAVTVGWRIYDARGVRVRTLLCGPLPAGRHVLSWNGTDDAGRALASGVYYTLVEGPQPAVRQKLLLLK